ncbi:MAG: hypothetical protein DMF93_12835 [Acidobacteria bacterium]|nr:MAG: hypothetical protein DMF93_12835 [Acidobacteriota bacterium]
MPDASSRRRPTARRSSAISGRSARKSRWPSPPRRVICTAAAASGIRRRPSATTRRRGSASRCRRRSTASRAASSSQAFRRSSAVRYLAFILSRFVRIDPTNVAVSSGTLRLDVQANPRQVRRGRDLGERANDIIRFYDSLIGDCPYPNFTLALVENDLPGGHSPAYFAALNQQLPTSPLVWRNDPAAFNGFPDFFIAHELAHQWWGQAVGWRNYHEQWISEGFAQYFAALYAQRQKGDEVFASVLRQMRKWAIDQSDQGPVYLGYRLGHIRGESRVFRALVYNKGATVLHMLRRFYWTSRFHKAGTDDFRQAMEQESGRPLRRFFDRWIYDSTLPKLKVGYRLDGSDVVLRVDQIGDLFDLPVTITLQYADRKPVDVVVRVSEQTVEQRVPLAGVLRGIEVSKDDGTLAEIVK